MELNYLLSDSTLGNDSYHTSFFGTSDMNSLAEPSLDDYNCRQQFIVPNVSSYLSIALPELSHDKCELDQGYTVNTPSGTSTLSPVSETVVPSISMPESSVSDDEVPLSPKTRRSVKHSISEKRRVVRFNTCVDSFMEMLNANGVSVRKNKLGVLVEVVRLVEKLQNEVSDLRKKEKEKKRQGELLQKLKIVIPKPSSVQQEYYTYIHNSGTNVVIITASGLIVDANAVFCNSINRDYSSVIGASFFSFAHVSTLPSLYTSFSAFLSGSQTSSQFIELFLYEGQFIPHCYTITHSDDNFIVTLVPLTTVGEDPSRADDVFMISGKSFCLLDQTHFPITVASSSSSAPKECGCIAVNAYNLESPKSPCVEVE